VLLELLDGAVAVDVEVSVRIPGEAAHHSEMIPPTVPG